MKIKLTNNQIELIAKFMAASNVGTMISDLGRSAPEKSDVKRFVHLYWNLAVQNHDEEGINLNPELVLFKKLVRQDPNYWVGQFEKEFGAHSVDLLK
jgi:hypothetical protein